MTHRSLHFVSIMFVWAACEGPAGKDSKAGRAQELQPGPAVLHDKQKLYEQSRALWETQNIDDYRFIFRRRIPGSVESIGPVEITVSKGQIARVKSKVGANLLPIDPEKEGLYVIDSLFAYLGHIIESGVDSLVIRYDAEFGFPYFAYVDDKDYEHTTSATTLEVQDFVLLEREAPADSVRATE